MKNSFLIFTLLILFSCTTKTEKNLTNTPIKEIIEATDSIKKEPEKILPIINDTIVKIENPVLKNKSFEAGNKTHFTQDCKFYFECDCCASDLIFNSDSTFYFLDYCMSDTSLRKGTYNIENTRILLNFDETCVKKEYNYENEIDTTAIDFITTEKVVEKVTTEYFATWCNKKIKLINTNRKSIAIETNNDINEVINHIKSEFQIEKITNTCGCFEGIGSSEKDTPKLTYSFKNGKEISICGYQHEEIKDKLSISEFDIFDCNTGKSYIRFGALDNCLIETYNDTLVINLTENIPSNENWNWNKTIVANQYITSPNDSIIVSEIKPNYQRKGYDTEIADNFLNQLKPNNGFDENWRETIGRLKFLSLEGNEKAWNILKNYNTYSGFEPDEAFAETWKESIASVKWLTDFE